MASGDTLIPELHPLAAEPPASNAVGYVLLATVNQWALAFTQAGEGTLVQVFPFQLPRAYDGGGLTATLVWTASATHASNNFKWSLECDRREAGGSVATDSFATAVLSADCTHPSANERHYTEVALTNAEIDGLLAGEFGRLRVKRVAGSGTQLAAEVRLIGIEVRET